MNDKNCQQCDVSCKTCNKTSDNCTSCKSGQYLDKTTKTQMCKKCNDNCETCEFSGDNCITCNQTSSFKYFFNSRCYDNCPNETKLNGSINKCEVKNNEKDDPNKFPVMLVFFILIAAGLFSLLIFFLYRNNFIRNKKSSYNLLNEIDEGFGEKWDI